MKKTHILAILVIAVAIGVIMSTAGDASTYVTFKDATEMANDGDNDKVHVVGKLKKNSQGNIIGMFYDPIIDANRFEFVLIDNNNKEQTVIYNQPKPQDFEKSEQVVIVGNMKGDVFVASQIIMKCPSKYEDKELKDTPKTENKAV
jgi:cytochrome c-type biogenesis protein CcmE